MPKKKLLANLEIQVFGRKGGNYESFRGEHQSGGAREREESDGLVEIVWGEGGGLR